MARTRYRIGVLFSSTGPYSVVARSMLNGALLAIDEINSARVGSVQIDPVVLNPGGDLNVYCRMASELLTSDIRHVVGCYTSSSRKEVIPYFEKHDALLWYPSHYEGFETSSNVIYTGAAPNQHILPLIKHLVATRRTRAFCIGSNYIWAWENNRILREVLTAQGGDVLAERYVPVGEMELAQVVHAIIQAQPSFVFSTLIGTSAYRFFRDFRSACEASGIDQAREMPVASCSLSEPELEEIGTSAVDGHLSSSVYFSAVRTPENAVFTARYSSSFPDGPTVSADAEASYVAVKLLAAALAEAGSDQVVAVKEAVTRQKLRAPQGPVHIDERTSHAYLTPRIGRSNKAARFDIIVEEKAPVRPDPYLVQTSPRVSVVSREPRLSVAR